MRRLLFCISFNGSAYHGWQVQRGVCTVQQTMQDVLEKILGVREDITGCSRTDAGVHAQEFYFHMDTMTAISTSGLFSALNCSLPQDIAVRSIREVPADFHARYCTYAKEYVYKIWNARAKNPFLQHMAWHYARPLKIERMQRAVSYFVGTHDFTSFTCAASTMKNKVRTIYRAQVTDAAEQVEIRFYGDGFLYHMVRILVGTLAEVSEGRFEPEQMPGILCACNRETAGRTAPPQGLYLHKVTYKKS